MINKALIIGSGNISKRHLQGLRENIAEIEVDMVSRRGKDLFLQNWKDIDRSEIGTVFQNLDQVPLGEYGCFVVTSETSRHYEQVDYLTRNLEEKVIIVEKPLFHRALPLESKSNRIYVAYNLRFHSATQKIQELLQGQKVLMARSEVGQYLPEWRPGRDYRQTYSAIKDKGGGVLLDISHEIDLIAYLFGELKLEFAKANKISNLEIDVEDYSQMLGRTSQGVHFEIGLDYLSRIYRRKLLIHTETSTIDADFFNGKIFYKKDGEELVEFKTFDQNSPMTHSKMYNDIFHNSGLSTCSLDEGMQVMKVIETAHRFHQ